MRSFIASCISLSGLALRIATAYDCHSDINLGSVTAAAQKGLAVDDDTFRWCPGQIPQLWPNADAPLTSLRLFKAWDDEWDVNVRHTAWTNLREHLVANGGRVLMGVPVTCDEAADDRHWAWTKELLEFLGPDRIMGLAIGNELELLRTKDPDMVPPECVQSIWEQGRFWARFQSVVSEFDTLGFGHLPVTSVFTGVALAGNPFQEEPGARTQSFLTNATRVYGDRFVFSINYYPFWDPNAWFDAGTSDQCSESIAWATSFESGGSVPGSLRVTRSKMQQLTGPDSNNQLWIGETGWSQPAPENFDTASQMSRCPAWASQTTFQRYYRDFLAWDLSIGEGARAPEHVFYFSLRDSWNFGKREGFGIIEGCNALACKIRSEDYQEPVNFEYVDHVPSDNFCEDGLLSEFYPEPAAHGHNQCEASCLVDPACQYFSYWETNWCRLTTSCAVFAHAPGEAILTFRKRDSTSPTPAPTDSTVSSSTAVPSSPTPAPTNSAPSVPSSTPEPKDYAPLDPRTPAPTTSNEDQSDTIYADSAAKGWGPREPAQFFVLAWCIITLVLDSQ